MSVMAARRHELPRQKKDKVRSTALAHLVVSCCILVCMCLVALVSMCGRSMCGLEVSGEGSIVQSCLKARIINNHLDGEPGNTLQQEEKHKQLSGNALTTNTSTSYNMSSQCLLKTGFEWVTMNDSTGWSVMSTVEAHPYPTGIQSRCDMVIGSRFTKFERTLHRRAWVRTWQPRTVFVRNDLLQIFVLRVLPCLEKPFVLIAGDSDLTLPRQVDLRFPKVITPLLWDRLLSDERVLHVFVENLDDMSNPVQGSKVSGLPLGVSAYNYPHRQADFILQHAANMSVTSSIADRPLRAMHVARMRDGKGQWADRQHVQDLCVKQWPTFCDSPGGLNSTGLWQAMQAVPFVLCAHGGGLDPSPKAWEALLLGSIPVTQHFPGDDAYHLLPVVFVDSWHEGSLTLDNLKQWRKQLLPWFAEPDKRAEVMRRLGSQFWWDRITAALDGRLNAFLSANPGMSIEWRPHPPVRDQLP